MPFLLGICSAEHALYKSSSVESVAIKNSKPGTLQVTKFPAGVVYAGCKIDEIGNQGSIFASKDSVGVSGGVLVGKIFDKEYKKADLQNVDFTEFTADPKLFLKKYWGSYAALFYDSATLSYKIFTDPQRLTTLFYTIKNGMIIYSTELALLYDALEEKPKIDTSYFENYLTDKNFALPLTPFKDIFELQPGMSILFDRVGNIKQNYLWDVNLLRGSYIKDKESFEQELLHRLKSCINAWSQDSDGLCIELSGGLDSSAVTIVARDVLPDKKIVGVNYIDSCTPNSNEDEHAQEVADACNATLEISDWQGSNLIDELPIGWRPNKPTTFLLFYNNTNRLRDIALSNNCSTIMNGQGGDHIFLAPQPIDSLADQFLDRDYSDIANNVRELSCIYRTPIWMLIKDMSCDVLSYYGLRKNSTLTADQLYLKEHVKNFYPGKLKHLSLLFHAVSDTERDQRIPGLTMIHPLLSQPIIELSLQIPTYQSFGKGFDRIFFRNAVSRIKRPGALWRTMKGETTSSMVKSLFASASQIQDILENGSLLVSGVISKKWLEDEIIKVRHKKGDNMWPIMRALTAQMWLNQWGL